MKISLDFDDFSVLRSRMDLFERLKEHYPNLKVSMFTIPFDYEYETSNLRIMRSQTLERIKKNLDWIQIIPHGLSHIPREFEKADRKTMEMSLQAIDEAFNKDGLPYEKGFKAPYWLWNQDVVDVLNENGWWGATDPNQPSMLKTKRYFEYSHSIDTPFWQSKNDIWKLHGHMTPPSSNNIEDCFLNLMKIPHDAEFHFVTDFINEEKKEN